MNEWNRQYTHKNSTSFPWESFGAGGANECPFNFEHGQNYDPNVHMDAQDPNDFHVGLFNGLRIQTQRYNPVSHTLTLTFNELQGPAHCILAKVSMTAGGVATEPWGDCSGLLPLAEDQSVATDENQPIGITLTGVGASGSELTYQITNWPFDGSLSGTPPDVTYSPDPGFTGVDSFDFLVDDGVAESNVATVSITVNDAGNPGLPADPADVAAGNADPPDGTAAISWTHDGLNLTGFEIRRQKLNKRGAWKGLTTVATVSAGALSYPDASGNGTFHYQVRALDDAQASDWMPVNWAEVIVTTDGGSGDPGTVNCKKKQNRDHPDCIGAPTIPSDQKSL